MKNEVALVLAKTSILIVLVSAIVAVSVLSGCVTTQTESTKYRVTVGNATVYAEVADTPAKRAAGLMNRASLNENAGMLFVFPTEQRQSFWMKDARIPLDIIFVTADMRVLEIYRSVPPCTSDPCGLYTSSAPIKYVLEVNSGFSERNGITSGDAVLIPPLS